MGSDDSKDTEVTPAYWLGLCGGPEARRELIECPDEKLLDLLWRFPLLVLPEFTDALEETRAQSTTPEVAQAISEKVGFLRSLQARLRRESPSTLARQYMFCGRALSEEQFGNTRVNLVRALRTFQEARSLFPQGESLVALCLITEGIIQGRLADLGAHGREHLAEALRCYREARTIPPATGSHVGYALIDEANARQQLVELGLDPIVNLEAAVELCRQARRILSAEDREYSVAVINEARSRLKLAQLGLQARRNLYEAIRLNREARLLVSPTSPRFGRCLRREGIARTGLARLGIEEIANLEESIRLYQQARAMFPSETDLVASCLIEEGIARDMLAERRVNPTENLKRAIRLYEEARSLLPAASSRHPVATANEAAAHLILAELGIERSENFGQALSLYRHAAARLHQLGHCMPAILAYKNAAHIARDSADWEAVLANANEAIRMLEEVRTSSLLIRDRQAWMERNVSLHKAAVEASLQLNRMEDAAEFVERGRSRTLADLLFMQEATPRNQPQSEVDEYRRLWRRAEEIDAALSLDYADETGEQEHRESLMLEKIEGMSRLREADDEIRRRDPDFFALAKPLSVPEMCDLARMLGRTLVSVWVGQSRAAAFFMTPGGCFEELVIPAVSELVLKEWIVGGSFAAKEDGWIGAYRRFREGGANTSIWLSQMQAVLTQLYDSLMHPIHQCLLHRGERRAAFVVSGYLSLLPLHASTWSANGEVHYLIEDLEISYAPSLWVLKRCLERKPEQQLHLLAVGNPPAEGRWPLPFSDWEVEQILRLMETAGRDQHVTPLVGSSATLNRVIEALSVHSVAHFSCHGYWNSKQPLESALMLGNGRLNLATLLRHPLLQAVRLVVLSACESGTGVRRGIAGEESLGLPAGFILAGAKSVIGSLWAVLDPPTALLMVKMYEHLLKGMGIAAALREAQLWLMKLSRDEALSLVKGPVETVATRFSRKLEENYRVWISHLGDPPFAHPHYWAAFQLYGSPQPIL